MDLTQVTLSGACCLFVKSICYEMITTVSLVNIRHHTQLTEVCVCVCVWWMAYFKKFPQSVHLYLFLSHSWSTNVLIKIISSQISLEKLIVLKSVLLSESSQVFSAAAAKSLQSCPTLCDPIDSSPPGSPVPGHLFLHLPILFFFIPVLKWPMILAWRFTFSNEELE